MTVRRNDIQGLRGLAVLSVVAFHAYQPTTPNGYLGVDAFFVISGFVVTPLLIRIDSTRALGEFAARRIRRLTPALGTMLLGAAVLVLLLGAVGGAQAEAAKLGLSALVLGANLGAYAYAGDYFHHLPNPLIHTWSLSVEEQIYVLLPLLLLTCAVIWKRAPQRRLVARVLVVSSALSLALTLALAAFPQVLRAFGVGDNGPALLFYATTSRIWEFGLGGLAVLAAPAPKIAPRTSLGIWLFCLVSLTLILIAPAPLELPFPGAEAVAAILTTGTLLFSYGDLRESPKWRPLQWLGDRSYSIYLWHMPLIVIAAFSPAISRRQAGGVQIALAVIATVIVGAVSYSAIEERYREQAGGRRRVSLATIGIRFVIVPVIALGFLGFAERNHYWGISGPAPLPAPWTVDASCKPMTNPAFQPCWYGAPSARSALLVGDSHAAALSQAFVEAGFDRRTGVMTRAFCPLLVEDALAPAARLAVRTKLGEPCARHNAVILDLVKASRPDTVVVTARSSAAYGYLFGTDREQYLSLVDASLKSLSALVPRLVIVGPVAEFPDLNMGHALFQSDATSPVSIGELPAEPFEDDARLRELARRIGARYISGVSDFCDALTCRYTLYMDATHLNLAGAQLLQPALRAALVSDR